MSETPTIGRHLHPGHEENPSSEPATPIDSVICMTDVLRAVRPNHDSCLLGFAFVEGSRDMYVISPDKPDERKAAGGLATDGLYWVEVNGASKGRRFRAVYVDAPIPFMPDEVCVCDIREEGAMVIGQPPKQGWADYPMHNINGTGDPRGPEPNVLYQTTVIVPPTKAVELPSDTLHFDSFANGTVAPFSPAEPDHLSEFSKGKPKDQFPRYVSRDYTIRGYNIAPDRSRVFFAHDHAMFSLNGPSGQPWSSWLFTPNLDIDMSDPNAILYFSIEVTPVGTSRRYDSVIFGPAGEPVLNPMVHFKDGKGHTASGNTVNIASILDNGPKYMVRQHIDKQRVLSPKQPPKATKPKFWSATGDRYNGNQSDQDRRAKVEYILSRTHVQVWQRGQCSIDVDFPKPLTLGEKWNIHLGFNTYHLTNETERERAPFPFRGFAALWHMDGLHLRKLSAFPKGTGAGDTDGDDGDTDTDD